MPARRFVLAVLIVPMVLLAGCAAAPEVKPNASTTPAAPKVGPGTVLPDALVAAQCTPGATPETAGMWDASGTVKNTTDKKQDLEVLIHVGPPGGGAVQAHVVAVAGLAKDKTADWSAPGITPADPNGPCFIRVRVAK